MSGWEKRQNLAWMEFAIDKKGLFWPSRLVLKPKALASLKKSANNRNSLKDMLQERRIYDSGQVARMVELRMNEQSEMAPTRTSLIYRLKEWSDEDSWKVFFDTYWRLIYSTAVKAGLSAAEAQDVVQETIISVLGKMPQFNYDPKIGSFKNWLLTLTKWRILDQFKHRQKNIAHHSQPSSLDETATIDEVPDPAIPALEAAWNEEWDKNLMDAAVERVKQKVDARQFQIFDYYVCKHWPVTRIARTLKVSCARVYLTKHRVGKLIQQELKTLQNKPI